MSDLYIENFFQRGAGVSLESEAEKTPLLIASEESINQVHFLMRILSEEINKQLQDQPPFPLLLKKLEIAALSQNKERMLELLNDLEEMLDIKYLYPNRMKI